MTNEASQINSCRYIYLHEISEPSDNELKIVVAEAVTGDPLDEEAVQDESPPELGEILVGAMPIIHGPGCRLFELFWPNYIGYSVLNESYVSVDDYEQGEGSLLVEYKKSRYLDFIAVGTFASSDYPGPFKHWGINCLDHIVDVVSMSEPEVAVRYA